MFNGKPTFTDNIFDLIIFPALFNIDVHLYPRPMKFMNFNIITNRLAIILSLNNSIKYYIPPRYILNYDRYSKLGEVYH